MYSVLPLTYYENKKPWMNTGIILVQVEFEIFGDFRGKLAFYFSHITSTKT